MAKGTKPLFFRSCLLLMASLFALSASFQFNDPDWYFWIPLYVVATLVNLVNAMALSSTRMEKPAKLALSLGMFLLMKVVTEDFKAGVWSFDMRERVARKKFGSVLVIVSMFLRLKSSPNVNKESNIHRTTAENLVRFGMPVLVAFSYGLSFVFFVIQKNEMKF